MVQLFDTLTLDTPKRTSDGYLAVRAKAARVGIYDYLASEVGAPADKFQPGDTVRIYRDAAEVFAPEAVRSFIGKPITDDHPRDAVTADNWKRHARGTVMGAMRDGDYLAFDLVLMDKQAIAAVDGGKRELSNGYQSQLDWTGGTAPDGQRYDARQTAIRGNHVALVDRGRAGPNCAISDGERFALCDSVPFQQETKVPKILTIDGLPVNLSDEAAVEALVTKYQGLVSDGAAALKVATDAAATLTGEKAALEVQLADAKKALEPAALDKLVADRAALVSEAKGIVTNLDVTGKTDGEIRRAVVDAKMGDKAKDMDDAAIAGAYSVLAATAGTTNDRRPVEVIGAVRQPLAVADAAAARDFIRANRYA